MARYRILEKGEEFRTCDVEYLLRPRRWAGKNSTTKPGKLRSFFKPGLTTFVPTLVIDAFHLGHQMH